MLKNNLIALIITFILALLWLRLNDYFAHQGWISSRTSRKIIHIGTGPIFVLCWLLFTDGNYSRFLAALVPLSIIIQFTLVGLGVIKDQAAVDAMARHGDRREILRGPLYYGIVFVLLTLLYWKNNPTGVITLMLLCGGDGIADIVDKKFGGHYKLPWSDEKTWIGTVSVFIGGWILSILVLAVYLTFDVFPGRLFIYFYPVSVICMGGMIVESLPYHDIDNLTVPLVAVLLGQLLF